MPLRDAAAAVGALLLPILVEIIVSILYVMVDGFWANSKVYSSQVFPPLHPQIFLLSDAAPPFLFTTLAAQ